VAISVSGQAGLARFIKLPPVEAKKIPDIVRYEARQQIPFDLNDVIWDYQRMGGGSEEEGFALETEIGLFAMKRDAVLRTLEPFRSAGIEIDFIQLTPLALYNYFLFDQLHDLPPADEYDPENPPESIVILSLGTDATDLVVTNGYRVWQRSIPLGGSHFTKVLTKELKLTFAKAEHLKRNVAAAQDPKAVFQAMRPVFSDLLTELQRSIGYFSTIERAAKIGRIVALGNAMKLPGLRKYLSQSLGFQVDRVEGYRGLVGPQVLTAPAFKDNELCFGVCYGLALQGLGKAGLRTNLLPKEIVRDRLIRQKKPWAVAAAAVLLLACSISFASFSLALGTVDRKRFERAESRAAQVAADANRYQADADENQEQFQATDQIGKHLVDNVERRILWLELLKVLNECLPRDEDGKRPEQIDQRNELHITNLECQWVDDLSQWFASVKQWYQQPPEAAPADKPPGPAATAEADDDATDEQSGQEGPTGSGWVIQLTGHHYHNFRQAGKNQDAQYVRNTLIHNLRSAKVRLEGDELVPKELGISYPVLINPGPVYPETRTCNRPKERVPAARAGGGVGGAAQNTITLRRFDFVVHFCWQETTPSQRRQRKEKQRQEQNQAPD